MSWSGSGVVGFNAPTAGNAGAGGSWDTPVDTSGPNPITLGANTVAADTIGALWRGLSGTVDPFTQYEIDSQNATAMVQASGGTMSYDDALSQVQQTSSDVAAAQNVSWSDAAKTWLGNTFKDDGSGCSLITNPAGCYPSWLPYAAIGAGILLLLWVLRPYVMAAEE